MSKCLYCDNIVGFGSKGMCNKHYMKLKRHGNPLFHDEQYPSMIEGYYRDKKTRRRKHRVIWEEYYHEKLKPTDVIHHINLIKTDNDINNLWKYESASKHAKAHEELKRLKKTLSNDEIIFFENGEYKKCKKVLTKEVIQEQP